MMAILKSCVIVLSVFALVRGDECQDSPSPLTCHGARVVRDVFQQFAPAESAEVLRLADGVEVVEVVPLGASGEGNQGRGMQQDDSLLGRMARYLESHELKLRLDNLLPGPQLREFLTETYKGLEQDKAVAEARKKKDNGGAIMMMGLMMAKMMAALGFGGIGALALKALGVAMLALMLSGIIGVKKLTESHHDDGGHHVSYVSIPHHGEHHRRRRSADIADGPLPYRGWRQYAAQEQQYYAQRH